MREERKEMDAVSGGTEGGRRPTGVPPAARGERGLLPGQRWSVSRKREVVLLRLLRGESARHFLGA
jgi:hypothetical protein